MDYNECPVCGEREDFKDSAVMIRCRRCGLAILKEGNIENKIADVRRRMIKRLQARADDYGDSREQILDFLKRVRAYAQRR